MHSEWATLSCGIPQGTVLGPTLFLVFINNLPTNLVGKPSIFADDSTVFSRGNNKLRDGDVPSFSKDLDSAKDWAVTWGMLFKGALSRYSVIFCRFFLRQKNGADPTEAAPDQTNRGAGLVKIRASQSRDSACGNESKPGVEGLRYDLRANRCEGELKSSCTCFSHHLVLPRYQAFFPRSASSRAAHHQSSLAQCRCEWPLRRSALVKSSSRRSPEQGSETGEVFTGWSS